MTEHQPIQTAEQLNTEIQLYDKAKLIRAGMFLIAVSLAAAILSLDKTVSNDTIKQIAGLGYFLLVAPAGAALAGGTVFQMLYANNTAHEARNAGYQVEGTFVRSIRAP